VYVPMSALINYNRQRKLKKENKKITGSIGFMVYKKKEKFLKITFYKHDSDKMITF